MRRTAGCRAPCRPRPRRRRRSSARERRGRRGPAHRQPRRRALRAEDADGRHWSGYCIGWSGWCSWIVGELDPPTTTAANSSSINTTHDHDPRTVTTNHSTPTPPRTRTHTMSSLTEKSRLSPADRAGSPGCRPAVSRRRGAVVITGTKQENLDRPRSDAMQGARPSRCAPTSASTRRSRPRWRAPCRRLAPRYPVNNAGVGCSSRSPRRRGGLAYVIDNNLSGVFYGCHAALPHLKARGGGWIINISSLASKNAFVNGLPTVLPRRR